MDNELGILLSGAIDINKTVSQINKDLQAITKQLHNLELNVDLGKAQKDIQEFNKNVQSTLGNTDKGVGNVGERITNSISVDVDKLRKNNAQAFQEIDKLTKHYNSSLTSLTRSGGIDLADNDDIERLQKVNVAMKDLDGTVRKFQIRTDDLTDSGFRIVSFDEVNNIEKATKEAQKLADAMGKGREQSLARQRAEQEKLAQTQAKFSNKAIDDAHKEALAEKKKTDEMQHQLKLARDQAAINVQNLRRRYAPVLTPEDNQALDNYLNNMGKLNATDPLVRRHIQNLNMGFKGVASNIQEAGSKAESFGKQLQIAMSRIPIWMIGMTARVDYRQ